MKKYYLQNLSGDTETVMLDNDDQAFDLALKTQTKKHDSSWSAYRSDGSRIFRVSVYIPGDREKGGDLYDIREHL